MSFTDAFNPQGDAALMSCKIKYRCPTLAAGKVPSPGYAFVGLTIASTVPCVSVGSVSVSSVTSN